MVGNGSVVDFEMYKKSRLQSNAARDAAISEDGDKALDIMRRYRRRIPLEQRAVLSKNYKEVIEKYQLKPRDFMVGMISGSSNSLRTYLSRITDSRNDKNPATSVVWIKYIRLLAETLEKKRCGIERGFLYHKLLRGTMFHPKEQSIAKKEVLLMDGYLNYAYELDERFGVMRAYKEIASIAAEENIQLFKKNQRNDFVFNCNEYADIDVNMSDIFDNETLESNEWDDMSTRVMGYEELMRAYDYASQFDLSPDSSDTDKIIKEFVDDVRGLFCATHAEYVLHSCTSGDPCDYYPAELKKYPHALLGVDITWLTYVNNSDDKNRYHMEAKDSVRSGLIDNEEAIDDERISESDWVYLLLYPSVGLKSIDVYVVTYQAEATRCVSLREAFDMYGNSRFISVANNSGGMASECSFIDLLVDVNRIRDELSRSAKKIALHPILKNHLDREDSIKIAIKDIWEPL